MQLAWRPSPGQVALIEVQDGGRDCLTGVVVDDIGEPVVIDLGASPDLPTEDCPVIASFFAPDALYRVRARAAHHDHLDSVIDLTVEEVERVQRRTAPRVKANFPVVLSNFDDPGDLVSVVGETVDIGLGGCRVRTEKRFPMGCDPTVSLQLPSGDAIVSLAAILQSDRITNGFEYRLVFLELEDEDRERLATLVES